MYRAVFINYRGEDTRSYGALLYTELARQFGAEHVFLDCESVPAGADFVEELLHQVRSVRVLLAVIGPRWLTTTDATGGRRIDNPDDWIRRELVEAFTVGVRVIPVLTEQVEIPAEADLPADIAVLSRCQYRRLRHHNPTADLARIVTDLIRLDPSLAANARSRDSAPRQLPAAPRLFTGRATELAALTDAAARTPDTGTTVAVSAIGGAGGVGKTALALHWAYQHLHRFPDGQLYVNLRGFDPTGRPMAASEAVRGFLIDLGLDPAALPVEPDAQAARYRGLVAGKRMLIMADNARDAEQVVPLLPGCPTCTVLITSRRRLSSLAALYGAHLLNLDVLPEPDAHDLLAYHLGPRRLAAEPEAVAELLEVCAGLPLAVAIVAARVAHHPTFPLAVLAAELHDASARLDGLDAGDLRVNLRAVLSWSVRSLSPQAASTFGLLGIAPGPDVSLPAAASLTALPDGQTRTVLRELENASLVQQSTPGRYRMHDLIRLYATEQADHTMPSGLRERGLLRVADFFLHTGQAADRFLAPHAPPVELNLPVVGCHPWPLVDSAAALEWFDAEHQGLIAAQQMSVQREWHHLVWHLAWILRTFHRRRGYLHDEVAIWRAGLTAAGHLADPARRIVAHRQLGNALVRIGRDAEGLEHLKWALALAEHAHDILQQARTRRALAGVAGRHGENRLALEHATQALTLFRSLGVAVWEADALAVVGWCAARLGQYDQARAHCRAALAIHRHHRNYLGEAETLGSLGYVDHAVGHHAEALDHYQQALTLYRVLGHSYEIANVLDALGNQHAVLGEFKPARAVWAEAVELYRVQRRDAEAVRMQQQLDALEAHPDGSASQ